MAEVSTVILPFVPTLASGEPLGGVEDRTRQTPSRFSAGRDGTVGDGGAAPWRGPPAALESDLSDIADIGFLVHLFAEQQSAIEGQASGPAKDVHRRAFSAYLTAQEMAPAANRAAAADGSSYNLEA